MDAFLRRPLGTGRACSARRKQEPILALLQSLVKSQQGRWPDHYGCSRETTCGEEQRPEAERHPIQGGQSRCTSPRPIHDQELLRHPQAVGTHGLGSARSKTRCDCCQQMDDQDEHVPHEGREEGRPRPAARLTKCLFSQQKLDFATHTHPLPPPTSSASLFATPLTVSATPKRPRGPGAPSSRPSTGAENLARTSAP